MKVVITVDRDTLKDKLKLMIRDVSKRYINKQYGGKRALCEIMGLQGLVMMLDNADLYDFEDLDNIYKAAKCLAY